MIIVDTNVVSDFMGTPPASAVLEWLNAQDATALYLTSISLAEISLGLQLMPDGKRRRLLCEQFELFVSKAFESRILPFDQEAAPIYAALRAQRQKIGRPISVFDAQIAAIARSTGWSLATRNTRDFEECGIELINPFG